MTPKDEEKNEKNADKNRQNEANEDENETKIDESPTAIEEEARFVAVRIASLIAEKTPITLKDGTTRPIQYRDIAILLRSTKNKALPFVRALANHENPAESDKKGIPVHADLSTGYFDAPEIAYTLNLLRILDNPRQDIPLTSTLLSPYAPNPFTHNDFALIRLAYDKTPDTGIPFHEAVIRYAKNNPANRLQDALSHNIDLANRLNAFLDQLELWRAKLLTQPLHEALSAIFTDARIFPYLAGLDAGDQRIANLQALHRKALTFSSSKGGGTTSGKGEGGLHRFLRFFESLFEQENADYGEAPVLSEASDVVRIMSIHKSKGLEFPVVFISGLGSKFNLSDATGGEGANISVHRDLGIALQVFDPTRNLFYPSVLTHMVVESNRRSLRAEELRLLYVALTRARNRLILTGHINKEDRLDTARYLWSNCKTPIPEDILLRATTALDWLLPALAAANLRVQWPDIPVENPDIIVTTHQSSAPGPPPSAGGSPRNHQIPPPPTSPAEPGADEGVDFDRLLARITGQYAHHSLAQQAAVLSVTQLKKSPIPFAFDLDESPAIQLFPPPSKIENKGREGQKSTIDNHDSRTRGLATHRILELLNFSSCSPPLSPDTLSAHIRQLVNTGRLTPADAAAADQDGIQWFLSTPIAARLRTAAADPAFTLRREIPFTWATPLAPPLNFPLNSPLNSSPNPADWPTIRGVIDLLLVNRVARIAEIIDYKTDSLATWQQNAPTYRRQMFYYLRAASQILAFPVSRATLIYLTPKNTEEILFTS